MPKQKTTTILVTVFLLLMFVLPLTGLAQRGPAVDPKCTTYGGVPVPSAFCGYDSLAGKYSATGVIVEIINIILWIVGLLAVLFVVIGGVRYITAHGNEEQAEDAKKTITQAVVGIIIVVLSFVIIRVITVAVICGNRAGFFSLGC